MRKALLLNPPAAERVSRDYYCGHVTKGRYYWPQLDLVVLSGFLAVDHEVEVLDATVEGLSFDQALRRVDQFAPDVVVSMTAAVSWSEDMRFLAAVRERREVVVLVSGDYARAEPEKVLAHNDCVDAVILDFTDAEVGAFLGDPAGAAYHNLCTRHPDSTSTPQRTSRFSIPVPQHHKFPLDRYHLPTILKHPFAVLMTDYSCPYECSYCYFERIDYKRRDLDNLRAELEYLRDAGIFELELMDPSFGSAKSHAMKVCELISDVSPDFSWFCEMRVDAADETLLRAMKGAGCHTLMFGVDSPNEAVMDGMNKPTPQQDVYDAFGLARRLGLRTLAHFVVGFAGETEASLERLIRFSIDLDPDFASFNVARPMWNTTFRDEIVNNGWLIDDGVEVANADYQPVWQSPTIDRDMVLDMRNRAEREFYLRPSYVLKQLRGLRTTYQFKTLVREGYSLLRDNVVPRHRPSDAARS